MRILAITNLYPNPIQPHRAPFNRHQLRLLGERHPLQIIAPISWTDELQHWKRGTSPKNWNRRVALDGLEVEHPRYYFPPRIARQWYGHAYHLSVLASYRRALRSFIPDIVFAAWAYPDGWAAVKLAHSAQLPVVLQVHGSDILLLKEFPARSRRTAEAVGSADGVVAVSHDLARNLEALGVSREKIAVNHDGVDRSLFFPGDKTLSRNALGLADSMDPVVLFIGNLVAVKAVDVLLQAISLLHQQSFRTRLIIVGSGPLQKSLESLVNQLGISNQVQFKGALPQKDLPLWYRAADLFVLPSHSEGVPNVLLEASACGTPWIASRVGGIPEIAHQGRSTLVPANSPDILAYAIRNVIENPPAPPAAGPRDRSAAVDDLEAFLLSHCRNGRRS